MNKSFRRILDLIRRTGDRMVVTDPDGEDAFVVMDLDQYEALLGLDDGFMDDFLGDDDVNPEPPTPSAPPSAEAEPPKDIWDVMPEAGQDEPTWDYAKLTEEERADFEQKFAEAAKAKAPAPEPKTEEKPKEDDDLGEEQFYLEPIE